MRRMISDDRWAAMEPLVAAAETRRGGRPPVIPGRQVLEALLYPGRTGVPLRDQPGEFGGWGAAHQRPRRRCAAGGCSGSTG